MVAKMKISLWVSLFVVGMLFFACNKKPDFDISSESSDNSVIKTINDLVRKEKNSGKEVVPSDPQYSFFTSVGIVKTRIKNDAPCSVVVDIVIGYDMDDNVALTELNEKLDELRIFFRDFFSDKMPGELRPENEERLKQEMVGLVNTNILNTSKIRIILFTQFDVMYQ
jgi:flagellar basal body-associated protein FliL